MSEVYCFLTELLLEPPNGVRKPRMLSAGYPLVGGTREHHFTGINSKPRKLPENAQTPTSRVLACKRNRS
jgi:hypothetical protein